MKAAWEKVSSVADKLNMELCATTAPQNTQLLHTSVMMVTVSKVVIQYHVTPMVCGLGA